ncbi:MAG: hypothetical protein GY938_27030 [Ketobacter sp.]|nr:hypothetical protein [Ketobacter sp.]
MKLAERIIEALGGVTSTRLNEIKSEFNRAAGRAYEQGVYDVNDEPPSGTTASYGYRRATTQSLRDFTKMSHDDILDTVWSLWQSSPIAVRTMKLKRDHIVGHGVTVTTQDEALQTIIDDYWIANEMDKQVSNFALQLFLLGEQCFPTFVKSDSDGSVEIGYIDPQQIKRVVTHPENALRRMAVILKPATNADEWVDDTGERIYRIVQTDNDVIIDSVVVPAKHPNKLVTHYQATLETWETAMLKAHGLTEYSGDVFFTPHNALSNQARGYSDLTAVADWIDQCEETLFALADREQFAGYFSWFVKLSGLDPNSKEFKERVAFLRINPPSKGSVNITNESEDWELKTADLKQTGSIETFRAILGLILGGLGIPVHWFGFGDDANRATAAVQATPTQKSLEYDQNEFKNMLMFMLTFVRDQAEIAGTYKPDSTADNSITIVMPEINEQDTAAIVNLLNPLATALMVAIDEKWMSQEKAMQLWAKLVNELGVELDPITEMDAIVGAMVDSEQDNNDRLKQLIDEVPLDSLDGSGADAKRDLPNNVQSEGVLVGHLNNIMSIFERMSTDVLTPEAAVLLIKLTGVDEPTAKALVDSQRSVKAPAEINDNN